MANFFHKIKNGLNLQPQTSPPAGLQDGDIYHDAVNGLMVRTAGSTVPAGNTYAADGVTLQLTGNTFAVRAGGISNTHIATAAAIGLNKLAALTANRLVITDGSGFLTASTVTTTEQGYLSGVTGAIQTQLDGKQPLDGDLTAIAALNTTGYLQRTGANTWVLGAAPSSSLSSDPSPTLSAYLNLNGQYFYGYPSGMRSNALDTFGPTTHYTRGIINPGLTRTVAITQPSAQIVGGRVDYSLRNNATNSARSGSIQFAGPASGAATVVDTGVNFGTAMSFTITVSSSGGTTTVTFTNTNGTDQYLCTAVMWLYE